MSGAPAPGRAATADGSLPALNDVPWFVPPCTGRKPIVAGDESAAEADEPAAAGDGADADAVEERLSALGYL